MSKVLLIATFSVSLTKQQDNFMTERLHAQDLEAERLQGQNDRNEATASAQGTAQAGSDSGQGNPRAMLEIQNLLPIKRYRHCHLCLRHRIFLLLCQFPRSPSTES